MTLSIPGGVVSLPDEINPYGISVTKRLVVPAAEQLLYQKHSTFGGEQITLVDYMGGDLEIERVATAGHLSTIFPEKPELPDFIRYLERKAILTPFKAVQFKFQIQCSIMDALHIVYDKRASVNEYSGRYSVMLETGFFPTAEYLISRMKGIDPQTATENATRAAQRIAEVRTANYGRYQYLIGKEIDLARELARAPLAINTDTKMFWKIELDDLCAFIAEKRDLKQEHHSLQPYLDYMETVALAVAPEATKALLYKSKKKRITLTIPHDHEILDPLPLPASWLAAPTRRVTVPVLEDLLYVPQLYYDHGKVQAVSYMGDNNSPVESARISYGLGTTRQQEDRHLIRYLIRHRHTTPFEHVELAVEAKTPAFADPRQGGRHRTLDWHGFMGEPVIFGTSQYVPAVAELKHQDRKNRQGRGNELDDELKETVLSSLHQSYDAELTLVGELERLGVSQEDQRREKGVGFYTFVWRTGDLQNWSHYFGLRLDAHAQKEIRDLGNIYARFIEAQAPDVMEAIRDYRLNALQLTAKDLPAVAALLDRTAVERNLSDVAFYHQHGLTTLKKKPAETGYAEGVQILSREGEELQGKLRRLLPLIPHFAVETGKFIVLEGIDGSGTTTQSQKLANYLFEKDKKNIVLLTREPTKLSPEGKQLRRRLSGQLLEGEVPQHDPDFWADLFINDRKWHVDTIVSPALDRGQIVISDRHKLSTIAYQSTQGADMDNLIQRHASLRKPDLTILVDVPAEIAMERMSAAADRTSEYFDKVELQKRIRDNYLAAVEKLEKSENIVIVDGTPAREEVTAALIAAVNPLMGY